MQQQSRYRLNHDPVHDAASMQVQRTRACPNLARSSPVHAVSVATLHIAALSLSPSHHHTPHTPSSSLAHHNLLLISPQQHLSPSSITSSPPIICIICLVAPRHDCHVVTLAHTRTLSLSTTPARQPMLRDEAKPLSLPLPSPPRPDPRSTDLVPRQRQCLHLCNTIILIPPLATLMAVEYLHRSLSLSLLRSRVTCVFTPLLLVYLSQYVSSFDHFIIMMM
jgi:hypothetical protein